MNITELQEKRNRIMTEATTLVAGTEVTAEQRSKFDTMLSDVAVIDGDINRVKAIEEHRASMSQAVNQPRPTGLPALLNHLAC